MPEPLQSDQIGELAAALAKAQAKIRGAAKDAQNPHLRNRYADLTSVWDACRGPLTEHGLAVVQSPVTTGRDADDHAIVEVETTLLHTSGQWVKSRCPVIYGRDEKGLKPMQMLGSAITYARRYGLSAIAGVCPEDDDGEGSHGGNGNGHGGHHQRRDEAPSQARPESQPEPDRDRERERPRQGGQGNYADRPPRTGKALFAWCKDMEERHEVGLLKYLNGWAKLKEFPARMVDWDDDQVAEAHEEAVRKLASVAPARDEGGHEGR